MITSNIKEQLALIILDTFPHLEELKDLLTNDETKLAADLQMDSFSICFFDKFALSAFIVPSIKIS